MFGKLVESIQQNICLFCFTCIASRSQRETRKGKKKGEQDNLFKKKEREKVSHMGDGRNITGTHRKGGDRGNIQLK